MSAHAILRTPPQLLNAILTSISSIIDELYKAFKVIGWGFFPLFEEPSERRALRVLKKLPALILFIWTMVILVQTQFLVLDKRQSALLAFTWIANLFFYFAIGYIRHSRKETRSCSTKLR